MYLILGCLFLALALIFIIFGLAGKVKLKSANSNNLKLRFEKLDFKKKTIVVALCVFMASVILIQNIAFALIFAGLYVYFAINRAVKNKKKIMAIIDKQTIEALSIIKSAVISGQSVQNAVITASKELKEPLKAHFVKMADSLALGLSFDEVLSRSSQNAPSKEFKMMIDTIKISKDSGASLSDIFERITASATQRQALRAKVSALTAQGRMSGNIVSVIPFVVVLMMYLIEPDMTGALFFTTMGNILLLLVTIMVLTGSFVISKLTEIDL